MPFCFGGNRATLTTSDRRAWALVDLIPPRSPSRWVVESQTSLPTQFLVMQRAVSTLRILSSPTCSRLLRLEARMLVKAGIYPTCSNSFIVVCMF